MHEKTGYADGPSDASRSGETDSTHRPRRLGQQDAHWPAVRKPMALQKLRESQDTHRKREGLTQTSQPSPKIRKAHEGREEQPGRTRRLKQEQLISEDTIEDTQTNRLPIRKR
eukprot:scpid59995/ scgid16835/ 